MKRTLRTLFLVAFLAVVAVIPLADAQFAAVYTTTVTNNPTGVSTGYIGLLNIDGGAGATNGITLGSSATATPIKALFFLDVALTPGSQATITCAPQSFTVTGVAVNDYVVLTQYPATGNGTGYGTARVSAANTVAQTVCNPTAGALTPAAGTFSYMVVRR